MKLPERRHLLASYRPYAVSLLAKRPDWRFSTWLGRWLPAPSARVLFGIGACREACELFAKLNSAIISAETADVWARSLFELNEFKQAREVPWIGVSAATLGRVPNWRCTRVCSILSMGMRLQQ